MKRIFIFITLVNVLTISQAVEVVNGKVMNRTLNMPIENVQVKSSIHAVLTDQKGDFTINVKSIHEKLEFYKKGYVVKTLKLAGNTSIGTIYLEHMVVEKDAPLVLECNDMEECLVAPSFIGNAHSKKTVRMVALASSSYLQHHEQYAGRVENGFKQVRANPLSTFSIDVDNAAYSNIRRYLNNGSLPPQDAVKVEEMVNYFRYNYTAPTGQQAFAIHQQLGPCPWNSNNQLLQIGLQAPRLDVHDLPASNFVFLVDVSGSMNAPNKLPLLKSSLKMLVNSLRPQDFVSMVTYAGYAGVALNPTSGNNKSEIIKAIDALGAGGSTAGSAGLLKAYELAEKHKIKGGNNRIILATDGDFNVGPSDAKELKDIVEEHLDKGIFISVLGFGMGNYKDDKMEAIAQNGNGNHAYIDNVQEAKRVLVNEMGGTLFTVAKDVKIQVEFNPSEVFAYRLVGYENRLLNEEDFNDDKVDAGEIGAGHQVTALYEIVPDGNTSHFTPDVDPLKYQAQKKASKSKDLATIKVRYKSPVGNTSKKMEVVIQNELTRKTDEDFNFASAVANFGMLLSNSDYVKEGGYTSLIEMAKKNKGLDEEGYRAEFIRLAQVAQSLSQLSGLEDLGAAASKD